MFPTQGPTAAVPACPSWGHAASNLDTFGSFESVGGNQFQMAYLPKSFPVLTVLMPTARRQGMFGARSLYLEIPPGFPFPGTATTIQSPV